MYKFLLPLLLVIADQGFKMLAVEHLKNGSAITVIPGIIGLRYAENTGAAFSILSGKVDFLIIITSAVLIVLAVMLVMNKIDNKIEEFCFVLIFAGGAGNLIDRILLGKVVDYLEFLFIDFPIFNFADILVCCGVGLYAVYVIATEIPALKKKGNNNAE